jgi:hypothetical protein
MSLESDYHFAIGSPRKGMSFQMHRCLLQEHPLSTLTCENCGVEFSCSSPLTILYKRKQENGCWNDRGASDLKLFCRKCAEAFVSGLSNPLEWGEIELQHFLCNRKNSYPLWNFLLDCFWGPLRPENPETARKLAGIVEKIIPTYKWLEKELPLDPKSDEKFLKKFLQLD